MTQRRMNPDTGQYYELRGNAWVEVPPPMTAGQTALGAVNALGEGMTFNLGDEVGSGVAAVAQKATGAEPPLANIYGDMRDIYNTKQGQFREENPGLNFGAQMTGGLLTGVAAYPRIAGSLMAAKHPVMTSLLGGTTAGLISGAGGSDVNRGIGAIYGGLTGLATAPLAHLVGSITGKLGQGGMNLVNIIRSGGVGAQPAASRAAREALREDDLTIDAAIARQRAMGEDARLVDVGGPNLLGVAEGAVMLPGGARTAADEFLEARIKRSSDRLMQSVERELGADGAFLQPLKALAAQRTQEAAPLYRKARKDRVPAAGVKKLYEWARKQARMSEGTSFAAPMMKLANSLQKTTRQGKRFKSQVASELHMVKRDLDDKIGAAIRKGENDKAKMLLDAKRRLLTMMDEASPSYSQARQIFSDSMSEQNALELGRRVLREDAEETIETLSTMTRGEREYYVIGAVKAIRDKLMSVGDRANSALRLAGNPQLRERLRPLFDTEESWENFTADLAREDTFADVTNKLLRNSRTAQRQQSTQGIVDQMGDAALSSYSPTDAALSALRMAKGTLATSVEGVPPQVLNEIGNLMFKAGPDEAYRILTKKGIPPESVRTLGRHFGFATSVGSGSAVGSISWE